MNKLNFEVNLDNLSEKDKKKFLELVEKSKEPFNPFERVKKGEIYYNINYAGDVYNEPEEYSCTDDSCFNSCNYYNDKVFAKHQALREMLNRKLMKFSYKNGGGSINILDKKGLFSIFCDDENCLVVASCSADILTPVFISREVAQRAVDEIIKPFMNEHPDFKWWG